MCDTCGCGTEGKPLVRRPGEESAGHSHHHHHDHDHDHHHDHDHDHHHDHDHDHHHDHDHGHGHGHSHEDDHRRIDVARDILSANTLLAERNRGFFDGRGIFSINMMSSPGSGKTTLLERTIRDLGGRRKFYVVEGDQQTMNDAERIEATGAPAVQVNTGNGCHLDASMVNEAVKILDPEPGSIVVIENVGNLVCPSLFELGESKRVVVISVTEGDDKPAKYPTMFERADLCIINKTDLLPYVDFDIERAMKYGRMVNHHLEFIKLSARSGEGLEEWYSWLEAAAGD